MSRDKSNEQGSGRDWEAKIIAHAWKDQNFKRKLLSNPEQALKEFGCPYPQNRRFNVIEEKENEYTLVIPKAPSNTMVLSEQELIKTAGATGGTGAACCESTQGACGNPQNTTYC
jgi:hypothetical protein